MALAICPSSMLGSMVDDQGRTLRVELRRPEGYAATLMCQSAGQHCLTIYRLLLLIRAGDTKRLSMRQSCLLKAAEGVCSVA